MKTPHLLASFAVAATAAAADLKDPNEVAREWEEKTAQTAPATGPLNLRDSTAMPARPQPRQNDDLLRAPRGKSKRDAQVPPWGKPAPRAKPTPREPLYDAPGYQVPDPLPDQMPPGTKAWEYGGQTYWLLPLIPSREK